MSFQELVQLRRSLRSYSSRPVPTEAIQTCLEAARLAPSACNAQPWHYLVVTEPERVRTLALLTRAPGGKLNNFVEQAPVIVAVVAERPNISSRVGAFLKRKPFYLLDIGISAEHFCLQAEELGLGTCMIGWFQERAAARLLGVPRSRRIALLITLGYSGGDPSPEGNPPGIRPPKKRKPLGQIASSNNYGTPWQEHAIIAAP
ncbi:Nitroreductase [Alkalispirochaeta americana]|uniref:Nitroreductase n=1 Tax=Alkalispirochaeta americana TaxID=159291 RepID=A0A1N6Q955_9SPIO|nr:nitroreductase family protein [Alkalispirochaeta americana]SIQ13079.1 Nitroreductase [Alkalispirochaeta americana]